MGIAQIGPLFWAVAEYFFRVNRDILQNPTKQRKF